MTPGQKLFLDLIGTMPLEQAEDVIVFSDRAMQELGEEHEYFGLTFLECCIREAEERVRSLRQSATTNCGKIS